jgi:hypothetical protein
MPSWNACALAMPARPHSDRQVATSQELLQSALQRSMLRNAEVARRRLRLRWALWGLGCAVCCLGVPMLIGAVPMRPEHVPPERLAELPRQGRAPQAQSSKPENRARPAPPTLQETP